jgi:hypothetical protein
MEYLPKPYGKYYFPTQEADYLRALSLGKLKASALLAESFNGFAVI